MTRGAPLKVSCPGPRKFKERPWMYAEYSTLMTHGQCVRTARSTRTVYVYTVDVGKTSFGKVLVIGASERSTIRFSFVDKRHVVIN